MDVNPEFAQAILQGIERSLWKGPLSISEINDSSVLSLLPFGLALENTLKGWKFFEI